MNEENLTRYDQLREKALTFHAEHPEVWGLFVRFTFDRIGEGFKNFSCRAIFHRIRWETQTPGYDKEKEFKLNDHLTPFYARWFMSVYPEHDGFFRLRKQKSKEDHPSGLPELTPTDFPYIEKGGEA